MKKFTLISMAIAMTAMVCGGAAFAQSDNNNWRNASGTVWKNGTNELCWRTSSWTPTTADPSCDGAYVPPPPFVPQAPAPKPAPKPAPVMQKISYQADTFFDFDKAVLKSEALPKLNELIAQAKAIKLEVVIALGYTDGLGSEAYNLKLSEQRAEAVKTYFVTQGIDPNRIYTEGKGKAQPVADNKTEAGRAKNRRVEIEIVGSK